jgi:hypothetical protein
MYLGDIYALAQKGPVAKLNYAIEIPQANTVERIISIIIEVASGASDKDSIRCLEQISDRQKDYYLDATSYLGFIKASGGNWHPTRIARLFSESSETKRTEILIRQMFGMHSIRTTFLELVSMGNKPLLHELKAYLPQLEQLVRVESFLGVAHEPYSEVTIGRRAESSQSWIKWIFLQVSK